ncbi:ribosome maturation factor RimP [Actinokineospora globicatena]|uniref:ribosome maturation factor RimP n=1 Tax=Actinokineospora globicatena TaxID=103729 RepID=UPI0020A28AA1|nr:ribosome maturation factor RimP [Actinokineospora globicatena]MCP2304233.1 ribosome maturation factor RimP [Actinokineospora globicatena]GLW78407.1 ribosome maturation factor RimP [Actinokineospora globicatena]GLW84929.1 ribosome maturation factor RimP [Actinokineospora globicatena]
MANQGQGDPITAELEPVVAGAIAEAGFELEQLDVAQAGRRRLVRVVVDGDDGVGLDEVAVVSRAVAAVLDEHDAVLGGPYTLEVTSPGVDRPLTRPRHWRRARLRLVKVRPVEGTEFTGRVGAADEDTDGGVQLLVGGALRRVGYHEVAHAVVEVEFKQPPVAELAMLEGRASGTEEDAR